MAAGTAGGAVAIAASTLAIKLSFINSFQLC